MAGKILFIRNNKEIEGKYVCWLVITDSVTKRCFSVRKNNDLRTLIRFGGLTEPKEVIHNTVPPSTRITNYLGFVFVTNMTKSFKHFKLNSCELFRMSLATRLAGVLLDARSYDGCRGWVPRQSDNTHWCQHLDCLWDFLTRNGVCAETEVRHRPWRSGLARGR